MLVSVLMQFLWMVAEEMSFPIYVPHIETDKHDLARAE